MSLPLMLALIVVAAVWGISRALGVRAWVVFSAMVIAALLVASWIFTAVVYAGVAAFAIMTSD